MALATITMIVFVPTNAYGWPWEDAIQNWVKGILVDIVNGFLSAFAQLMQKLALDTVAHDFSKLLGNSGPDTGGFGSGVYGLAQHTNNTFVMPIAHSILALVMLIQLVKISQRIDASATMPAIRDVVFLMVFYAIFFWLINNSFEICRAVFNELEKISLGLTGMPKETLSQLSALQDTSNLSVGALCNLILITLLMYIMGLIAWLITYFSFYARAIMLYVMATFAPIPLAMLGFEETRSFGVNFCKNFITTCLAGAIMTFILLAFPMVLTGLVGDLAGLGDNLLAQGIMMDVTIIKMLAICLLLIAGLLKAGSWAKDLLGG